MNEKTNKNKFINRKEDFYSKIDARNAYFIIFISIRVASSLFRNEVVKIVFYLKKTICSTFDFFLPYMTVKMYYNEVHIQMNKHQIKSKSNQEI